MMGLPLGKTALLIQYEKKKEIKKYISVAH